MWIIDPGTSSTDKFPKEETLRAILKAVYYMKRLSSKVQDISTGQLNTGIKRQIFSRKYYKKLSDIDPQIGWKFKMAKMQNCYSKYFQLKAISKQKPNDKSTTFYLRY